MRIPFIVALTACAILLTASSMATAVGLGAPLDCKAEPGLAASAGCDVGRVCAAGACVDGAGVAYRLYGPGHVHWGSASVRGVVLGPGGITCVLDPAGGSCEMDVLELHTEGAAVTCISQAAQLPVVVGPVTVGAGDVGATACAPDPSNPVPAETLRVKVGRVEFKT